MSDIKAVKNALQTHKKSFLEKPGLLAIGIGFKTVAGKETTDLAIICSVKKKKALKDLSAADRIPEMIENIPTDVIETAEIVAQADPTGRFRPVPGGVSIGHRGVTAGTLGAWVKKDGIFHLLSNNHVIANSNSADVGDPILQPGTHDGGNYPKDAIAELVDFIKIKFGGPDNLVDAAIAIPAEIENGGSACSFANAIARPLNKIASGAGRKTRLKPVKIMSADELVRNEILEIGEVSEITEGLLNLKVKKYGRTTKLTKGKITQVDASVKVQYTNQSAWFADQLITTDMSDGGDSGSLVVSRDDNKAVGLLFAGSDTMTVINRIQNVFSSLGISF